MTIVKQFKKEKLKLEQQKTLAPFTSLKIGGKASYYLAVSSSEELRKAIHLANKLKMPYYILGNGSNTLVLDYGVDGLVLHLSNRFSKIELIDETTIRCEAGALLKDVCLFALEHNLSGMEDLYGIPASVGGALYMNAGAFEGEIKDVVTSCEYIDQDGTLLTFHPSDMYLSYRHSYFMNKTGCIATITFSLKEGEHSAIKEKMDYYYQRRVDKQPLEYPSAGSTFKRPYHNYASALIDQCKLKGYRINDAEVSTKHAGFLINKGNATSKDFIELILYIQSIVYLETGFKLHPEVQILR